MALFALTYHYCDDVDLVAAHRPEHRAYLAELFDRGELLVAGPLGEPGRPRGLLVLDVDSADEVHKVAAADPFMGREVITEYEVGVWTVSFGAERLERRQA
jgi:hypothetical protein